MSGRMLVAGEGGNPLKSDEELQNLLKKLDSVKKYKTFQGWKTKFLDRLEQFLYEEGMVPSEKSCKDFTLLLSSCVKSATKVGNFIEVGDLGESKKTVKAALSLNEMCNSLTTLVSELENLIPSNSRDEKKRGFTKFHLGAVLIRQGFHQYITMKELEGALTDIGTKLEHVADKQQNELFTAYATQVQRFCDVMADLNLYEIMMKCLQFVEPPEEEESEEPETVLIIITTPDGKIMRLELEIAETIGNIKAAIASDCQIPPEKQVLKLLNGKTLDDNDQTLEGLGIQDGSKLTVEPFKIPITVNTMDGKTIEVMVDPSAYLSDIKKQLEDESGVPAKNQRLFMNGEELVDDLKTAEAYGIKAGSELDLEPKSIKITVETPDGKSLTVEVSPSDTSDMIKAKITGKTGMAAPQQVLKFQGKELPSDGSTIKDMGIREGSELTVEVFKVPITVNTMDGKTIKVMVDPTAYLSDIKKQLEGESGVPAKNQRLFMNGEELVDDLKTAADYGIEAGSELDLEPKSIAITVQTPDGKTHMLEVSPSDTSDMIKAKIAKNAGMKVAQQVLKSLGKEFPSDGSTVKDMGIRDGSALTVEVYKVSITVNTIDGKKIKVMVDPTNTMSDIKKQLEDEAGVPAKNQRLSMNGEELSDDNKTAADYGIKPGSELDLEPKSIKITVETPDGKTHTVQVSPSDTSDNIKAKIAEVTGMAAPQQLLKVLGKELPSDGSTVKDMGIRDGSALTVEFKKVPITVNTIDGKKIKVMVDPTNTISDIKKQLEGESGLPSKNQRLFLKGEELMDDKKTAADYGIEAGSELDLEPKSIEITVETPDGKTHTVEVTPSDTSDTIKTKIAAVSGMVVPRQVLIFEGKKLPSDGSTVKDMGIRDGSALTVDIYKVLITVETSDGKTVSLDVEPSDTIDVVKKMIQKETGIEPKKQLLKLGEEELKNGRSTVDECGIKAGSTLTLEQHADPIIFVDIRSGTLFAVDRAEVIEKNALTPHQNNKLDFTEAAKDSIARGKILQLMKDSPALGVATQVVVTQVIVEDYELENAGGVASKWGVNLKKREKNKKGEEFLFVDPKTGATGELSRKKYVDMKFITPVTAETIEESEKDTMKYEKYISDIRNVFGVKSAT